MGVIFFIVGLVIARFAVAMVQRVRKWRADRREWRSPFITVGIAKWGSPRPALCTGCAFAHIVRGAVRGEERIFCGYVFPPQEHFFTVRECTDFRPRRKPSRKIVA